jgi:hypothetical protein
MIPYNELFEMKREELVSELNICAKNMNLKRIPYCSRTFNPSFFLIALTRNKRAPREIPPSRSFFDSISPNKEK